MSQRATDAARIVVDSVQSITLESVKAWRKDGFTDRECLAALTTIGAYVAGHALARVMGAHGDPGIIDRLLPMFMEQVGEVAAEAFWSIDGGEGGVVQ